MGRGYGYDLSVDRNGVIDSYQMKKNAEKEAAERFAAEQKKQAQLEKKRIYAKTRSDKKNLEKDKTRMAKIKELDAFIAKVEQDGARASSSTSASTRSSSRRSG